MMSRINPHEPAVYKSWQSQTLKRRFERNALSRPFRAQAQDFLDWRKGRKRSNQIRATSGTILGSGVVPLDRMILRF